MKNILPQIGILLLFWLLGEVFNFLTSSTIPSSIIGMLLLVLALECKLIKLYQVEKTADFLIRNMAFFFIPPGVGLMLHLNLIAENWWAILIATFLSTVFVLGITALVAQVGRKKE